MDYIFTEKELPEILKIDWSLGKKWDCLQIPTKDLGLEPHETALKLKDNALRQNVMIEWMIYEDISKFYIVATGKKVEMSNAIKLFSIELYDNITASYPDPVAAYCLRKHYPKASPSKFKDAIDYLAQTGKITIEIHSTGKKGRPSHHYLATNGAVCN